ncbi:mannose-1-phosphate guanylyltransferase/mannose-6-phosphate isomerase [Enterobacter asburiae]|uniref:mannose-1-phosphate guanylyltransferase/mannose-6-phosphate isomerase n=1 Tax=Enterobacter asburiae TaxID=61645 RepID=UPI002DB81A48|nr:mannose-1-phosphate guanylyltransferase/mannose-6-phosphate isomerase [Enterobacter asburiae]MEB7277173.1 mannose-1-phosphate guanylyltransferase/mannose-6-phosphate isomerase [Enterobacter asburiae]
MKIIPVIMAGGSGSRLWPLSRLTYPKQFLTLEGEQSMLQQTILRLNELEVAPPVVICNEEHRFIVAEQLRQINALDVIILEPIGRNTAPAVALAAFQSLNNLSENEDALLLILAADHIIKDGTSFINSIHIAKPYAIDGNLVTFGIEPTMPETGFGYIQAGEKISSGEVAGAYKVSAFVEKPELAVAEKFLSDGGYYWNSGMFMFCARKYLSELHKFCPDIYDSCSKAIQSPDKDLCFIRIDHDIFSRCPDLSIDYAVMEHTANAVVVPMSAGWSDVGSWSSLWNISNKDDKGNVLIGDIIIHNSSNNYVHAQSGLVTMLGVEDLIVVQTKDAILVTKHDAVQDVKKIVEELKSSGRSEYRIHREVYRPWGKCDSIDTGKRYEVKRIEVNPGEGISLQTHFHRSEHWVVVAGTAKVTLQDKQFLLGENESVYIPVGAQHCLENPGKIPLEIIEVRSGPYLGDDDIVRISDRYGRV